MAERSAFAIRSMRDSSASTSCIKNAWCSITSTVAENIFVSAAAEEGSLHRMERDALPRGGDSATARCFVLARHAGGSAQRRPEAHRADRSRVDERGSRARFSDEPTAALSHREADDLFRIARQVARFRLRPALHQPQVRRDLFAGGSLRRVSRRRVGRERHDCRHGQRAVDSHDGRAFGRAVVSEVGDDAGRRAATRG